MLVIREKSAKPHFIEKKIIDEMEGVVDEELDNVMIKNDLDGVIDDLDNPFDDTIPVTVEMNYQTI